MALLKSLAAGKPGDALLLTKADGSAWNASHQARPMAEACKRAKIDLGGIAAWPLAARAQQSTSVARIGFLNTNYASQSASYVEAFRAGLRDLGHVEGKNFVVESRFAEGNVDRLPDLAAELVRVNVDVII